VRRSGSTATTSTPTTTGCCGCATASSASPAWCRCTQPRWPRCGTTCRRDQLLPAPAGPGLLLSTAGTRLGDNNLWRTFHRLIQQAGSSARSASCQPRIHDLRHSFAVATLLDWYARGADVQALLPRLSTYLGHADPKHTYWYLSAAPELLALAAQRVDAHRAGRP
jgi:integrase/recombinase XerD